jgi:hypothetical protein
MGRPPLIVATSSPAPDGHDAPSYAAWLDQALAEAEGEIAPRLRQAAWDLQRLRGAWQGCDLSRVCATLEDRLALVDFALLEKPGWFARFRGQGARSARELIAQHDRVVDESGRLAARVQEFARKQEAAMNGGQRALLGLEMECRALGDSVSQATQWLESLSGALAASAQPDMALLRYASAASGRLKRVHIDWTAALEVLAHWRACANAHEAFMELLGQEWAAALGAWRSLMKRLVEEVEHSGPAGPPARPVLQAHKELRRLVHRVYASCSHLKHQEDLLVQALAGLGPAQR